MNELCPLGPSSLYVLGRLYLCPVSSQLKEIVFSELWGILHSASFIKTFHSSFSPLPLFNLKFCCLWVKRNLILFLHKAT